MASNTPSITNLKMGSTMGASFAAHCDGLLDYIFIGRGHIQGVRSKYPSTPLDRVEFFEFYIATSALFSLQDPHIYLTVMTDILSSKA